MEKARNQGVELLAFPELALTPFFAVQYMREFEHYFIESSSSPLNQIRLKAKELGIHVIVGYAEKSGSYYYNTAILINKEGQDMGSYRKMHLPAPLINDNLGNYEKIYFSPGNLGYPVFNLGDVKVGLQICYDRHFPEGFRSLALAGADIIFNLTATSSFGVDWRSEMWELLLRARAFENGVFIVGINKSGIEYGKEYYGKSMIISPLGANILSVAEKTEKDTLILNTIDLTDRHEAYLRLPYLRDLRAEDGIREVLQS
jgi:predicted amidohydrolase